MSGWFRIGRGAGWLVVGVLAAGPPAAVAQDDAAVNSAVAKLDADWPLWRGPRGNNHAAAGASVPDAISREAIVWELNLPGRGHSSPIVVGDTIYLTTADKTATRQSVLAASTDGRVKWGKHLHTGNLPRENHPKNTEASPSIASDGESLFVSFYNDETIQLSRLDLDGEVVWTKTAGPYSPNQYKYGYAASPTLYRNGDQLLVIVVGDYDGAGAFLKAFDAADGSEVWAVKRPGMTTFSSPIVARCGGRDRVLISGGNQVASYDPATGEKQWANAEATTMATCGTMVWNDDLVFASGGYPDVQTVCLKADTGALVWENDVKCYEQSMLLHDGSVYAVADRGIAYCWDAATGERKWRERLGGDFSSSPVLVGDVVHVFNERGTGYAFDAKPDAFNLRSTHQIAEAVFATPAVVGNTMYLRVIVHENDRRQEKLIAVR